MWACRIISLAVAMMVGNAVGPVYAQIRGGAETAQFEPGDHGLYQENLSGTPIGAQVEGWEIVRGSYEVAEFEGKRWFRPLTFGTYILRKMRFPRDFSVEFTAYFFEPGGPELRVFLYTDEDLKREYGGPDGPAQVYLNVWRGGGGTDGFRLRKRMRPSGYQDVADREGFPPNRPHRIALVLRGGQLTLFFDGERAAVTPFEPEAPIVAIGFLFLSRGGHELPYKDRPALLTEIRIAEYSQPVGRAVGGVFLYWVLPVSEKDIPRTLIQDQTYNGSVGLEALRQRYGWREATMLVVQLPANPFEPDKTAVRAQGAKCDELVQRLKRELEVVRQLGGGLLIMGDGGEGHTERERKLLASARALAFATWLAQKGIGDPQQLNSLAIGSSGYDGVYYSLAIGSSGYDGVY